MIKMQWHKPVLITLERVHTEECVLCFCKSDDAWIGINRNRGNNACFINKKPSKMLVQS